MSNYYLPVIWHRMGSKSHSNHPKQHTSVMPARRRDPVSVPRYTSRFRHDHAIDDSITRAGFFSNAVLDDTEAAAARSRGKDYDLLRNTNTAIRRPSPDLGSSRLSRPISRYQSLPPVARKTTSSPPSRSSLISSSPYTSSAVLPYRSTNTMRSMLSTPSPTSLLSSKINMFLRGSSVPPGARPSTNSFVSYKSYLDSATPLPPTPRDESMSVVSYKSHLSDPSITSPFSTRSSSRLYRGYSPSPSLQSSSRYQGNTASSLPRYNISLGDDDDDYDYGASDDNDDDEYEPLSYRRKYKIIRGRQALPSRPASTLYYTTGSPVGSDDEDDTYSLPPGDAGTYSCPRPSGSSPFILSSYESAHDGTYEADMAEMYDYVPFGPSRQGILELTQRRDGRFENIDDDDDDDDDDVDTSPSLIPPPSSSLLLTLPPSRSSLISSPGIPPFLYPKPSSDLTSPSSSLANKDLFDSLLSSTAARARASLRDAQQLSSYRNASLLMSVEGSAISEDGKNRYGFRYYPPPIPIKGSGVGLDERILGITPKPSSPADSFFSGYLDRLRNLRSEMRDREDKADSSCGRSVVVPRPLPSYCHSTVHMPVHIAGRSHNVPVSSYRSHADERGLSHRVDVFPLLENDTKLTGRDKLHLPVFTAGGDPTKLTMLEKINIKIATEMHSSPRAAVASMKARASSVPPKVQARPARLQQQLVNRPKVVGSPQVAPTIIYVSNPPLASNPSSSHSRPVVQSEVPWRMRASSVSNDPRASRAGSLPPRPRSYHPGIYEPNIQPPLPTESMAAHRRPVVLRSRAGSVPPQRPRSFHSGESEPVRIARAGSMQPSRPQSYHPGDRQCVGTEGLRAHKSPVAYRFDRAQSLSRLVRKPWSLEDELEEEKERQKQQARGRPTESRPSRGMFSRAASEPPKFIRPSEYYPSIPDVKQRALVRYLYARRGLEGSKVPNQHPMVYLPPKGPTPSNRPKAAIIGSKMETEDGGKRRRKLPPVYNVEKREPSAGSSQSAIFYQPEVAPSGGLQSSRPPLPKQSDRKAIRTVDGFSKPKNVMSWEYRLESRISPNDLIYQPASIGRMRDQVRGAQEKMDRHRQLLDRYLDADMKPSSTLVTKRNEVNSTSSSVNIPAYYYAGGDPDNAPMSDLRRRLRRTLARTKNNPDLYKD